MTEDANAPARDELPRPSTAPNVPTPRTTTTRRCRASRHHAQRSAAVRGLRRRRRSRSCTSSCRRSPACGTRGTGSATATRCGWSSPPALECLSFGGYIILFRTVFVRGSTRDRLARELPDHDGRPGGDAPVRRRRRRRHRADGLGAAALGHAAGASWPAGWSPSSSLLYAVYMGALVIVGSACTRDFNGRRRLRDHGRAGDLRAWSSDAVPGHRAVPARLERRLAHWAAGLGGAWRVRARAAAGRRAGLGRPPACARRSTSSARANWGLLGAVAWWAFDIGVAVGVLPRLRRAAAVRGHRHGATSSGSSANILPLPGGIGGVDGGMIGAFVAFGVAERPRRRRGARLPCVLLLAADDSRARSPTSSCASTVARWSDERAEATRGRRSRRNVPDGYYTK